MTENFTIPWLKEPEEKDCPAALSYLSLFYGDTIAQRHETALRKGRPRSSRLGMCSRRPASHSWPPAIYPSRRTSRKSAPDRSNLRSSCYATQRTAG